jgi:hypothetical protein
MVTVDAVVSTVVTVLSAVSSEGSTVVDVAATGGKVVVTLESTGRVHDATTMTEAATSATLRTAFGMPSTLVLTRASAPEVAHLTVGARHQPSDQQCRVADLGHSGECATASYFDLHRAVALVVLPIWVEFEGGRDSCGSWLFRSDVRSRAGSREELCNEIGAYRDRAMLILGVLGVGILLGLIHRVRQRRKDQPSTRRC